jgi:hypothetical protein
MPYRCARTGMYYPDDYVEQWGRKYGIGLGPKPVSEALVSSYHMPIAIPEGSAEKAMHPLESCQAQMDYVDKIPAADIAAGKDATIIAMNDPDMRMRADLMREKQLDKSTRLNSIVRPA